MSQRSEIIHRAGDTAYDVCVIGGGATGAGCALDARLRNLKTLLLEAGDFGSASSSASTKLIHGGLRYLQQAVTDFDAGQYHVVRLALRERRLMMANAPHLTRAMRFAVPCFGPFGTVYNLIGLKLYDWLSGKARMEPSRFMGRDATRDHMPWLKADRMWGTVIFSDGQFDDSRYNLALVQSCANAGGDVLNYARVTAFRKDERGRITGAQVQDEETKQSFLVNASVFVNATGVFSDHLRALGDAAATRRLRPSKGVHIMLPLPSDFGGDALLIPATEDGRIIFAVPWMGRLLVGTTETEAGPADEMMVTKEEAEYLLHHLNHYLRKPFQASDIMAAIAGLRPLIQSDDSRATKKLIRDYEIELQPTSGLVSVLGGKWTVYRAMAEDAINAVGKLLHNRITTCRTQEYRLFGSAAETPDLAAWPVSAETARHLVGKFGSHAHDVLSLTETDPSLLAPLAEGAPQIRAEVVYCVRQEMARSVEDVLSRRLGLQVFDWNLAMRAAPVVAEILAGELGWSTARATAEFDGYVARIAAMRQRLTEPARAADFPAGPRSASSLS